MAFDETCNSKDVKKMLKCSRAHDRMNIAIFRIKKLDCMEKIDTTSSHGRCATKKLRYSEFIIKEKVLEE